MVTSKPIDAAPNQEEMASTAERPGSLNSLINILLGNVPKNSIRPKSDKNGADVIIIAQAANTGLTGGSTPNGTYDRPVVVMSMQLLGGVHLLDDATELVALPAATLQQLETTLAPLGREPHSVLGSSCYGTTKVMARFAGIWKRAVCH